jgi:hypothetical protein
VEIEALIVADVEAVYSRHPERAARFGGGQKQKQQVRNPHHRRVKPKKLKETLNEAKFHAAMYGGKLVSCKTHISPPG